ncbi:hypothetical protein MRX96_015431 [Rhipicephalus microplus]
MMTPEVGGMGEEREGRPCPETVASPVACEGENNTLCVRSESAIFGAYRAKRSEEVRQPEEGGGIFRNVVGEPH